MSDVTQTWTVTKWLYENGNLLAVLVAILAGSYYDVWTWGKTYRAALAAAEKQRIDDLAVAQKRYEEAEARWKADKETLTSDRDWWRAGCLRGWNVAGTAVDKLEKTTSVKSDAA
jgi:hypothetical protein